MFQIVQIAGSLLVLAAFVGTVLGRLEQGRRAYLIPNAVGSAVLAATAVVSREWGFVLLEGVWSLVSAVSLLRAAVGGSLTRRTRPGRRPRRARPRRHTPSASCR